MQIQSTRLGQLEVKEEDILFFHQGLPGFIEERKFVFLPYEKESPFAFLQSVTNADLTFIVVNPFAFITDYSFELDDAILCDIGITEAEAPQVVNIVRIPKKAEEMSVNLMAPIIINWKNNKACQIVLENSPYSIRQRLFPNGFANASNEEGKP